MLKSLPLSPAKLRALQDERSHALTVRDFHAVEVLRLSQQLEAAKANLYNADEVYRQREAAVLEAQTPGAQ